MTPGSSFIPTHRAPDAGLAVWSAPDPSSPVVAQLHPGSPVQVVSGLASSNVFAYTPPTSTAPAYVGVTLAFPPQGANQGITLNDGAALRNPSSGS